MFGKGRVIGAVVCLRDAVWGGGGGGGRNWKGVEDGVRELQ